MFYYWTNHCSPCWVMIKCVIMGLIEHLLFKTKTLKKVQKNTFLLKHPKSFNQEICVFEWLKGWADYQKQVSQIQRFSSRLNKSDIILTKTWTFKNKSSIYWRAIVLACLMFTGVFVNVSTPCIAYSSRIIYILLSTSLISPQGSFQLHLI